MYGAAMPYEITCPQHPDVPPMHLAPEAHAHIDAMHPYDDPQNVWDFVLQHRFVSQADAQRAARQPRG